MMLKQKKANKLMFFKLDIIKFKLIIKDSLELR